MNRRFGVLLAVAGWGALSLGTLAADVTLANFETALIAIPVVSEARVLAALDGALKREGFPGGELLRLVERLSSLSAAATDKETLVLTLVSAIEEGIPVDSLLNKAFEGLARGVPLTSLNPLLVQRLKVLIEARDLFYAKGVFRVSPGASFSPGAAALPELRFDAVLTQFGDAIGDYVESGGSPLEGHLIYQGVETRLKMLRGSVLVPADVDLVLDRIDPADLTRIVLAALN